MVAREIKIDYIRLKVKNQTHDDIVPFCKCPKCNTYAPISGYEKTIFYCMHCGQKLYCKGGN